MYIHLKNMAESKKDEDKSSSTDPRIEPLLKIIKKDMTKLNKYLKSSNKQLEYRENEIDDVINEIKKYTGKKIIKKSKKQKQKEINKIGKKASKIIKSAQNDISNMIQINNDINDLSDKSESLSKSSKSSSKLNDNLSNNNNLLNTQNEKLEEIISNDHSNQKIDQKTVNDLKNITIKTGKIITSTNKEVNIGIKAVNNTVSDIKKNVSSSKSKGGKTDSGSKNKGDKTGTGNKSKGDKTGGGGDGGGGQTANQQAQEGFLHKIFSKKLIWKILGGISIILSFAPAILKFFYTFEWLSYIDHGLIVLGVVSFIMLSWYIPVFFFIPVAFSSVVKYIWPNEFQKYEQLFLIGHIILIFLVLSVWIIKMITPK